MMVIDFDWCWLILIVEPIIWMVFDKVKWPFLDFTWCYPGKFFLPKKCFCNFPDFCQLLATLVNIWQLMIIWELLGIAKSLEESQRCLIDLKERTWVLNGASSTSGLFTCSNFQMFKSWSCKCLNLLLFIVRRFFFGIAIDKQYLTNAIKLLLGWSTSEWSQLCCTIKVPLWVFRYIKYPPFLYCVWIENLY